MQSNHFPPGLPSIGNHFIFIFEPLDAFLDHFFYNFSLSFSFPFPLFFPTYSGKKIFDFWISLDAFLDHILTIFSLHLIFFPHLLSFHFSPAGIPPPLAPIFCKIYTPAFICRSWPLSLHFYYRIFWKYT